MRIIGGTFKGFKLKYSTSTKVRPTQDRVRESLFNIIRSEIEEASFCDLFCGSASVGLEALSRGAKTVTCVDKYTQIANLNMQKIINSMHGSDYKERIKICTVSVFSFLNQAQKKYDIIYLDPPWDLKDVYKKTLNAIVENDILNKSGLVICEHNKKLKIEEILPGNILTNYNYGQTMLTLFKL